MADLETVHDTFDHTGLTGVGGSSVLATWEMVKNGSSQNLTNNTDTLVTFEAAGIDSGGSVIDLAGDEFDVPATGLYLALLHWRWTGTTVPTSSAYMTVKVGGSDVTSRIIMPAAPVASVAGSLNGIIPLSLTAADVLEMYINPGAVTGAQAAGSASVQLQTRFALVRLT